MRVLVFEHTCRRVKFDSGTQNSYSLCHRYIQSSLISAGNCLWSQSIAIVSRRDVRLWKKLWKKITFNFQVNNGEWFTWIQLSDQELRNSKFLKWRYTVNIANRLTSQHLHFLWGCLTCSSFSVAFQADSDFYVVAELLKDYIGLIQAVKVWSDVLMSAVMMHFNSQLLFCIRLQHPECWKII